jgi:peptidoglycan/LPS O-acetylase OafA/YrhL
LWPAVLAFGGRRAALISAALMVLLAPLVRIGLLSQPGLHQAAGEAFPAVADMLAAGCLLALLRDWLSGQSVYLRLLGTRAFFLVPLCAFVLNGYRDGRLHSGVLDTMISIALAVTVDRCARFGDTLSGRFLNSRVLVQAGSLSYSIYLWQQPLLAGRPHTPAQAIGVSLITLSTIAWASHRYIEKPFLEFRNHIEPGFRLIVSKSFGL